VFARSVDRVEIGGRGVDGFELEIGGMDYGFAMQGILGMDFLLRTGAILNLQSLTFEFDR
jgi:hypothetical protein